MGRRRERSECDPLTDAKGDQGDRLRFTIRTIWITIDTELVERRARESTIVVSIQPQNITCVTSTREWR